MLFMKRLTLFFLLTFLLSTAHTALAQTQGAFTVSAPDSVAGDYNFIALTNGWGVPANLCGDVVLYTDSLGLNLACNPTVTDLTGKIALVFRGTCGFSAKVLAAQNAGAIGVIVGNSATGVVPGAMGAGPEAPFVVIPAALISNADALKLKAALTAGATVTGCMAVPDVEVSFLVDMSQETVDPAGVYLGYNIEGEAAAFLPLTDQGNGLYGGSLTVPATTEIAYVYVNGITEAGIEVVPDCGPATTVQVDSVTFARYIYAGIAGADADKVCYGKCTRCQTIVTFRVNMSQKTIPATGVHIAGNFQGYDPGSTPLTEIGGNIYAYSIAAAPGDTLLYKFINGNTFNDDERAITAECGLPNGFGGFNRIYVVPNEDAVILPAVCFDSCGVCPAPGPAFCDTNAIICDGFDSYELGAVGPQSPDWDTWDGTGGEGVVTGEQFFSDSLSMLIDGVITPTQDVVLLLGDSIRGNYLLKWKMYIPAGKLAYYNFQHDLAPAHVFGAEVYFEANGAGRVVLGTNASFATFSFPYDEWFDVEQYIDIDNDATYMIVDSTTVTGWTFSTTSTAGVTSNQLAGIDFYPADATYRYFVDNVQFIKLDAGTASDFCVDAADINSLFGQPAGQVVSSGLYDNTNANTIGDPTTGYECYGEPDGLGASPTVDNSLWFTFTGDGNRYFIETGDCGSSNYITDGDTQISIYSGTSCSALTPVLCTEDGPSAVSGGPYPAGDTLQTVSGRKYYMLVDGFNFQGDFSVGEFCLKVKRLAPIVAINEVAFDQSIRLAPNPTNGVTNLLVSLPEAADLTIRVTNSLGQQVIQRVENNVQEGTLRLDMSRFAKGMYFVELSDGKNQSTRRLIVE